MISQPGAAPFPEAGLTWMHAGAAPRQSARNAAFAGIAKRYRRAVPRPYRKHEHSGCDVPHMGGGKAEVN